MHDTVSCSCRRVSARAILADEHGSKFKSQVALSLVIFEGLCANILTTTEVRMNQTEDEQDESAAEQAARETDR